MSAKGSACLVVFVVADQRNGTASSGLTTMSHPQAISMWVRGAWVLLGLGCWVFLGLGVCGPQASPASRVAEVAVF